MLIYIGLVIGYNGFYMNDKVVTCPIIFKRLYERSGVWQEYVLNMVSRCNIVDKGIF